MMKSVAVFFTKPGFDDYPFDGEDYRIVYRTLAEIVTGKGHRFFLVRDPASYKGETTFKGGWEFIDEDFRRTEDDVKANVVYNKGRITFDAAANVVTDPELETLCNDKHATNLLFPHLCPRTIVVKTDGEFQRALDQMPSEKIVVKPLDRFGGDGVTIGSRDVVTENNPGYPCIVQEFIDTSRGIPGIMDGLHDFRIICIGGVVAACYIRTPPQGSLVANVSLGGGEITVDVTEIPEGALELFREVDTALSHFPSRVYSVDMGLNADGRWMLIELNDQPGAPGPAQPNCRPYLEKLADFLLSRA